MPAPEPPKSLLSGTGGYRPGQVAARVVEVRPAPLPRVVPTLTVLANGLVNLNAKAAALLWALGPAVCFISPPAVRPTVKPAPWAIEPGSCHRLLGRSDEHSQLRFRCPAGQAPPAGRYVLTPVAESPRRFYLLPA